MLNQIVVIGHVVETHAFPKPGQVFSRGEAALFLVLEIWENPGDKNNHEKVLVDMVLEESLAANAKSFLKIGALVAVKGRIGVNKQSIPYSLKIVVERLTALDKKT